VEEEEEEEERAPLGGRGSVKPGSGLQQRRQRQDEKAARDERTTARQEEATNRSENIVGNITTVLAARYRAEASISNGGASIVTLEQLALLFRTTLSDVTDGHARWPLPDAKQRRVSIGLRRAAVGHLVEAAVDHFAGTLRPEQDPPTSRPSSWSLGVSRYKAALLATLTNKKRVDKRNRIRRPCSMKKYLQ